MTKLSAAWSHHHLPPLDVGGNASELQVGEQARGGGGASPPRPRKPPSPVLAAQRAARPEVRKPIVITRRIVTGRKYKYTK